MTFHRTTISNSRPECTIYFFSSLCLFASVPSIIITNHCNFKAFILLHKHLEPCVALGKTAKGLSLLLILAWSLDCEAGYYFCGLKITLKSLLHCAVLRIILHCAIYSIYDCEIYNTQMCIINDSNGRLSIPQQAKSNTMLTCHSHYDTFSIWCLKPATKYEWTHMESRVKVWVWKPENKCCVFGATNSWRAAAAKRPHKFFTSPQVNRVQLSAVASTSVFLSRRLLYPLISTWVKPRPKHCSSDLF